MPKFLIKASYTADGVKGLVKDGGSGRKAAVEKALASIGGRMEAFYFAFGDADAIVICDVPNTASALAVSLSVNATGLVHASTTPLATVEEVDAAAKQASSTAYRAPGA